MNLLPNDDLLPWTTWTPPWAFTTVETQPLRLTNWLMKRLAQVEKQMEATMKRSSDPEIWTDGKGQSHKISEMTLAYIENVIAYLRDTAERTREEHLRALSDEQFTGVDDAVKGFIRLRRQVVRNWLPQEKVLEELVPQWKRLLEEQKKRKEETLPTEIGWYERNANDVVIQHPIPPNGSPASLAGGRRLSDGRHVSFRFYW